jgi:hypothetical protein
MARHIDWIFIGQVAALLCFVVSVPSPWLESAFWLGVLIALTCGPEHPWGKKANGETHAEGEGNG